MWTLINLYIFNYKKNLIKDDTPWRWNLLELLAFNLGFPTSDKSSIKLCLVVGIHPRLSLHVPLERRTITITIFWLTRIVFVAVGWWTCLVNHQYGFHYQHPNQPFLYRYKPIHYNLCLVDHEQFYFDCMVKHSWMDSPLDWYCWHDLVLCWWKEFPWDFRHGKERRWRRSRWCKCLSSYFSLFRTTI